MWAVTGSLRWASVSRPGMAAPLWRAGTPARSMLSPAGALDPGAAAPPAGNPWPFPSRSHVHIPHDDLARIAASSRERAVGRKGDAPHLADVPGEGARH